MKTVSVELCRELMVRAADECIKFQGSIFNIDTNILADKILAENNLLPVDLVVPWDVIDERFKFAAMDEDGGIHVYESRPIVSPDAKAWFEKGYEALRLDGFINVTKPSNKPWQETLIERTQVEENKTEVLDAEVNPHELRLDWDMIPAEYLWAAQDEDGEIWAYVDKPRFELGDWRSVGTGARPLCKLDANQNCKLTLTRRPGA